MTLIGTQQKIKMLSTHDFFKIQESALKTVKKSDDEGYAQVTGQHTKHQGY